jgi:PEP-CTERM motif
VTASPSEGAAITFVATADGEVSDQEMADRTQIKDGIFETVNATDDFLDVRFNRFEFTTHGVFEFDLGALPQNAVITSAAFVPIEFGPGHIALPSLRIEYETPPAAVPEPSTLLLLATGALPLARRLRNRRAA